METVIILLALLTTAATPAPASVQRLSPEQVERVLDAAAAKREAIDTQAPLPKPAIEGEMGVEVGTGGHRAAYGTALVPLGQEGAAILSFSSTTDRERRRAPR